MITIRMQQAALFTVVAFVFSTLTTVAEAGVLTVEEFMETHAGKCIAYDGDSKGVQCYHADGTVDYDDETYGKDTGTWVVKDDEICEDWVGEPGLSCDKMNDDGDGNYSDEDYTWTIID